MPDAQAAELAIKFEDGTQLTRREVFSFSGNSVEMLAQIQAPTLVIWGTHDRTLKPSSFPPFVSAIPGAAGHPIQGSGHQPHIGRPDEVQNLVLEFLKSLEG